MNMRTVVAGMAVVAVVAVGGYSAVRHLEGKTEQAVRDAMTQSGMTAEKVSYRLFSHTLDMEGLVWKHDDQGSGLSVHIDTVKLKGFDPDCLDSKVEGLPLVAEKLELSGLKSVSREKEIVTELGIGQAEMTEYRQNLARLGQAARNDRGEEFWRESYRCFLRSLVLSDYTLTHTFKGAKFADGASFTQTYARLGLLEPLEMPEGAVSPRLSYYVDQARINLNGKPSSSVARVEVRNFNLPSPAVMAKLAAQASPEITAEMGLDLLGLLVQDYRARSPYSSVIMKEIQSFNPQGEKTVSIAELEHSLTVGVPFSLGLKVTGLNVDSEELGRAERELLAQFNPDLDKNGLLMDGSVNLSLSPSSKGASSVGWTFGVTGLGQLDGQVEGSLAVNSFDELMALGASALSSSRLAEALLFRSAHIVYADQGGLALAIAVLARGERREPLRLHKELVEDVSDIPLPAAQAGLDRALVTMLEYPGKMEINGVLSEPMPFYLAWLALLSGEGELSIKTEPGPKAFADWLPASMK